MKTFLILFLLGCMLSCASKRNTTNETDVYPTETPDRFR